MVRSGLGSFSTGWQDALGSDLAQAVLLPLPSSQGWGAAGSVGHC